MGSLRNVPTQTLRANLDDYEHLALHSKRGADRIRYHNEAQAIRKELALREAERHARQRRAVQG